MHDTHLDQRLPNEKSSLQNMVRWLFNFVYNDVIVFCLSLCYFFSVCLILLCFFIMQNIVWRMNKKLKQQYMRF